jgi:RNA polymerase sigma-70 factor (ECF subfamily)
MTQTSSRHLFEVAEETMRQEARQRDEVSASLASSRSEQEALSSRLESKTLAAIAGRCRVGGDRKSSSLEPDRMAYDELVYAIQEAAVSAPAYLSRRSCDERNRDCRFVDEDVSDMMLLRNVADGDKAAMHVMFARHRKKVFHFIQRIVSNAMIVSDLVGQVFLDAWRSANRTESCAQVSGWLLLIVRFNEANDLQERAIRDVGEDDLFRVADARDAIGKMFDGTESDGIWRASIEKLSSAHAEIIQLFYYRKKSIAEVAVSLGVTPAIAKSRLFYARKQLARNLVSASLMPRRPRQTGRLSARARVARLTCERRRAEPIIDIIQQSDRKENML